MEVMQKHLTTNIVSVWRKKTVGIKTVGNLVPSISKIMIKINFALIKDG